MKYLKYLLLFVLISASVSALDFEISSEKVKDKISLEDVAEFDVTITNNADFSQKFSIKTLDFPVWDVYTRPVRNPITVNVGSGDSETIRLYVNPLHITSIGTFDVNVRVRSESVQKEKIIPLRVAVVSPGSTVGGYVPTVTATIDIADDINPKDKLPITLTIENQNPIEYPELLVAINSNLINKEVQTGLGAKEEKSLDFSVELDPITKPQKDTLFITIKYNNQTITGPLTKNINIVDYSNLLENTTEQSRFLRQETFIKYTNAGNKPYIGTQKVETTFFKSMFTTSNPKAKMIKEDGKRYLSWGIELEPNGSTEVIVTENYLPFIIILILLIVFVMIYFVFRKPLTVAKVAANVENREGGISDLKIVVTLKNRGKVALKDIEVVDRIPNIADIERELTIGTLQPTKILKHEEKGSMLKWTVDSLELGEERVISYRIKPILSIVGDFSLPPVVASYIIKGKKYKVRSNSLNITG